MMAFSCSTTFRRCSTVLRSSGCRGQLLTLWGGPSVPGKYPFHQTSSTLIHWHEAGSILSFSYFLYTSLLLIDRDWIALKSHWIARKKHKHSYVDKKTTVSDAVEFVLFVKCCYERSSHGISRCFSTCYLYRFLTQQPGFHCKLAMAWLSSSAFRPFLKTLPSSHHFLVSRLSTLTELKLVLLSHFGLKSVYALKLV